jgi:acyl dehydratase
VAVSYDEVEVGTQIAAQTYGVTRGQLVQYAGASGDFNIIHWNERFAKAVGLPDVIAHGMFTMATAARLVTDWVGDPAAVVEYGVRFSSMVPVPDDDKGVSIGLTARVGSADGADGAKVLTQARAVVQLS